MCFEIPEYIHFLIFILLFLLLFLGGYVILQKIMPSERAPYSCD